MFIGDRRTYSRPGRWMVPWAARLPVVFAAAFAGIEAAVVAFGTAHGWGLSGSPDAVAGWCAAALAAALIVAVAVKGRWFHPLKVPLAVVAVMSLAAPLWVQVTGKPAGLLYSPGYEPAGQPLAASLSAAASAALVLVVAGYQAGAAAVLAVTGPLSPGAVRPAYRRQDMRSAGFALLAAGAVAQALITYLSAGKAYGADQLRYGLTSVLGAAAPTGILAGLVVACASRSDRLRGLLRGREWAPLGVYMAAVAVSGQRAGLIAPVVFLAWAYSTRVRAIPARWAAAVVLAAILAGTVIAHHRADGGLSPGTPVQVAAAAAGDVSTPAWLTQQTAEHVPSSSPYLHGSTYVASVEAQLPGPVSRHLGVTARTASAVFRSLISFYDPNQGFAFSYPSEAYLNFGLPGCLGAGLFLGALMGWAWRKRRDPAARPLDLLYPVLLAGLVYGFRSDALTQVKDVLYPMLIVWAVMARQRGDAHPSSGRT